MKQTTLIIAVLQKLRRVLPQGAPDLDNEEVAKVWAELLQDIPTDMLVKVARDAKWTLQCEGAGLHLIDRERMTFKRFVCAKYVDILKVQNTCKKVVTTFYVDLLDNTEHVSISALLTNRKTKEKKRRELNPQTVEEIWAAKEVALERYEKAQKIERQAFREYEELLDLYLKKRFEEQENENNPVG